MKKNYLFSIVALFAMLFASCSQEEILQEPIAGQKSQVSIKVGVPGETVLSRAMAEYNGYIRRCIMQVVNAETGAALEGDGMRSTKEVTGETVTFTFEKPSVEYKVLFWADYVKAATLADVVYNTTDLSNITLKLNQGTDLFNQLAADAFCGVLGSAATSITLKRPFTKVMIKTDTPDDFKDFDEIAIGNFNVPDGYNIFTQTANTVKAIRLAATSMVDAAKGEWAYFFAFAPVNETAATVNMGVTLSSSTDATLTQKIAITEFPLDDNKIVNLNVKKETTNPGEPETPSSNITVEVSFGDEFENGGTEPETPATGTLAVGSFINDKGEVVESADDAIAVVYALATGKTDNSDYGTGKKAKAYAISLTKVTNRVKVGDLSSYGLETTADDYSGFAYDAALKAKLENVTKEQSEIFNNYYAATLPTLSGTNLSTWYIPSKAQLADAMAVNNEKFQETLATIYTTDFYLASSSVDATNPAKSLYGVIYKFETKTVGAAGTLASTTSAFVFPALTIFE